MQHKHGYDAVSPISAALTLLDFASAYGRWPHARECEGPRRQGILFSRTTYCKIFQVSTFGQVIALVSSVVSGCVWYTCLGHHCTVTFPRTQTNIRFCAACRKKMDTDEDPWSAHAAVSRPQLRRWGADLDGWDAGIDWHGSVA